MKNRNYLITYLCVIVIGVLLLLFNDSKNLFEIIVIIIGVVFLVPSVIALVGAFAPTKKAKEAGGSVRWDVGLTSIGGVVLGLLLICMPGFFVDYLIYTLSIVLIFCGIVQIVWLAQMGREGGVNGWFYAMPVLTILAGIAMIIIGPVRIANAVTIITGIFLIGYGANGLIGYLTGRRALPAAGEERTEH